MYSHSFMETCPHDLDTAAPDPQIVSALPSTLRQDPPGMDGINTYILQPHIYFNKGTAKHETSTFDDTLLTTEFNS